MIFIWQHILASAYEIVRDKARLIYSIGKEKGRVRQREKPRWYYLPSKHSGTSADQQSTQCSGTHTHTHTNTHVHTVAEPQGAGLWRDSVTYKFTHPNIRLVYGPEYSDMRAGLTRQTEWIILKAPTVIDHKVFKRRTSVWNEMELVLICLN